MHENRSLLHLYPSGATCHAFQPVTTVMSPSPGRMVLQHHVTTNSQASPNDTPRHLVSLNSSSITDTHTNLVPTPSASQDLLHQQMKLCDRANGS